jgi:hypothetical protein
MRGIGIVLLLGLLSCYKPEKLGKSAYFDVDSLLNEQITMLEQLKPTLQIAKKLNGKTTTENVSAVEDWKKRLGVFREINPANKRYLNSFSREELKDGYKYVLKPTEKGDLKEVYFFYKKGKLVSIRGKLVKSNFLNKEEQTLEMDFDRNGLSAYQMEGWQKMIFSDTSSYFIRTKVLYK